MNVVAKVGDFFAIPLSSTVWGCGVVARKWKSELYLVLFEETFNNLEKIREVEINRLTPCLASSSLDAKIWHGHWPVMHERADVSKLAQPIFKVAEANKVIAESFDRKFRRPIDVEIANQLSYRKGVAPVRLENALRAHHGISEWDKIFDELRYDLAIAVNHIVDMNE